MPRARHSAAPRAIRTRPFVALAVAAAGLTTAVWLPSRFDNAEATEGDRGSVSSERRDGDRVVFEDRFEGRRGAGVDREKWAADTGPQDGELQIFTDRDRNARLDGDGNLVISARRERSGEITSARLLTRETFGAVSGRAEARIKVADSRGVRSAFQLLGAQDVDVMENLGDASKVVRGGIGDREGSLTARESFADDFHTFAVEWEPGLVVWSVDGDEFFRTDETMSEPFTPSVSVAVGEEADDRTRLPQRMLVDLIRVTVRDDAEPPATTPPTTPPTTAPTTPPTTEPAPPPSSAPAPPPATTTPPAPAAKVWKPFTLYAAGDRVTFDGLTYEVREAHTSLPAWQPPAVPGLFRPL